MDEPVFGRMLTAMVTPFDDQGKLDLSTARRLACHLVDELGNDGLLISGTTGESPTTSDAEKRELLAAVVAEVGDRATIVAGVGTNDTAHSIELARQAEQIGADGLLVVTPYYSLPPQQGIIDHFVAVADATSLPVALYDIPHRAGRAIETESLITLAQHPRIRAVKDAKKDLDASSQVMAATDLDFYAGDDAITLPLLSIGGVGVVGTSTHFTGRPAKRMIQAFLAGDLAGALRLHRALLPIFTGVFATQGCLMVKAGLAHEGLPVGRCRAPLGEAPAELAEHFARLLDAADLN
ncbi:4-hydroxy-tetrahydrodipicolinate synthase [Propionibacterium cyclohexanicum]|uniref:4-hydroxy-tetrahydrodipicolinate synthase n=1 Tax=Propionibacterium cyclohexanicum TaxID=64702 RepID=A0A1H9PFZ1_9ACTN|nr:4-hydroxy-tetrahydrodipicolinate synthase [Propionibacterium cyclohexanicum]SER47132.1 4-hydroxy-tetrahydrodipicolinate synthase [Propionibacterium cyclohexanicum]